MNKINTKIAIWIIVGGTLLIWGVVLWLFKADFNVFTSDFLKEAIKRLPIAITIAAGIWLIFKKWIWKYFWLQNWLIVDPIIEGTWKGTLLSTWINPETGESPKELPLVLTIKQDFDNINCCIYTEESSSISYSGKIYHDEFSDNKRFIYTYTNKPKPSVRYRSEYHDGTANLVVVGGSRNKMEGEYWTTRKTTGEINVTFSSKKRVSSYSEAFEKE